MAAAPAHDVAAVRCGRTSQTFGALLNALFTAITVGPIGQGDLRANGVIVVRGEVVRHAQAVGQLENKRTMTKQVVVVHMTDTQLAEQCE